MEEKINLNEVAQYSKEFSTRVLDSFFSNKEKITGSEVLNLCELRQINLFVIQELFNAWKEQNAKNRSSFFDYEAEPVKEAMNTLMNVLSNHIAIDREHFVPLLDRAVYNTMLLIVDPYDFFADLIEGQKDTITMESFKEQIKYVKINKAPLDRLLEKLREGNIQSASGNQVFSMLDAILEEVNFTPEDVEGYISKFSAVVPVSIDRFYDQKISEEKSEPTPEASQWIKPSTETPTEEIKPTINEKLANEPRPTLADNFNKITRIKESLTINQKFMFTKVLFHGDFELFSKAIDEIDRQDHIQGALKYLEQNYEEWDRDSEEFHEFMELVEKRFG